jgi:hypothetical protein
MMMILVMMVGHAELHPLVQRATRPKIVSMAAVISPAVTNKWITPQTSPQKWHRFHQISSDFIYKGLWHQDVNVSWSIEVQDQNQAKNLRWVWVVIIWFAALAIPHISLSCPFPTSTVAITVKKIHVEICGILVTVNVGSAQKTPCPSMMGRPYRCARQIPRRRAKPTPDSRHSTQFLKSMC